MALITTIEELKDYNTPANLGIDMITFLPSVNTTERNYLIPEIGKELYATLTNAYEDSIAPVPSGLLTAELEELLEYCRRVVAPLAMVHYKAMIMAQVSDGGAQEKALEGSMPVRMWVANLQTETLFTEGMAAIDSLLVFLEENQADYAEWTASDAYTEFKEFLLQTTKEFDDEVKISGSRKFFKALRPDIKYAELQILIKHIGVDFYDRLLAGKKDGSLTTEEKTALKNIYPVIANYAIANTALAIEHGNDGTYKIFTQQEYSGKNSKQPPSEGAIEKLKANHQRRGQQYLHDLLIYLNKKATAVVFPEYYSSDYYTDPNAAAPQDINETLTKSFSF